MSQEATVRYKRVATGLSSYKLYPVIDGEDFNVYDFINVATTKDFYVGVYEYEQRHYDLYLDAGSLAGIRDVTTSHLIFDFDQDDSSSVTIENARDGTDRLIDRLINHGIPLDAIQIYFSGSKGFHVQVDSNARFDREQFTNMVYSLAKDLPGFDTRIIDQQRLIRIPFSSHQTSGLHKIPITLVELKTRPLDYFRKIAAYKGLDIPKHRVDIFDSYKRNIAIPESITSLVFEKKQETKEVPLDFQPGDYLDLSKKPHWIDAPRYALQEGFFIEGQRNTAMMILASFYKNQGFDADQANAFLNIVADKQATKNNCDKFPEFEIKNNVVDFVFSPHWKGGIYSKEHELLQEKEAQFGLSKGADGDTLVTISEVFATMFEEASGLQDYRVTTGIKEIDEDIILLKGMAFGLLGSPGSGKTSVINQIVKNMASSGKKVLYESLDMQRSMQGLKFLNQYLSTPINMVELNNSIRKNPEEFRKVLDKARIGFENIYFNYSVSSVENIIKRIENFRNKHGESPDLVVIDYLEKIRGPSNDSMRDLNHIIPRITDAAKEYKTCIALLLQPQKSSDGRNLEIDSPLTMRNIKGSSIIEQDLRVIFSIWRPGARTGDYIDDQFMKIAVVKNNMGPQPTLSFSWNGAKGVISTLNEYDASRLEMMESSTQETGQGNNNRGGDL